MVSRGRRESLGDMPGVAIERNLPSFSKAGKNQ